MTKEHKNLMRKINLIPHNILEQLNAREVAILAVKDIHSANNGRVFVSTSLQIDDLYEISHLDTITSYRENLKALVDYLTQENLYSTTVIATRLDEKIIEQSTAFFENKYRIMSELENIRQYNKDVYIVYVITHFNNGPCGHLTVNIGGDCYRNNINDLFSALDRTNNLAKSMLKKALMIFPDIPALHGGKKGEWIIVDKKGKHFSGISEESIIALGSLIIPKGIRFINKYKENEAINLGIYDHFPPKNFIKPDTGSPDVLSGSYWRGELTDKYINMCASWLKRGVGMSNFTCLPMNLGGTIDPSSRPTGFGVATTAIELAKKYFIKDLNQVRFLLEAAGGVGRSTVEALVNLYKIPQKNITIFDKNSQACNILKGQFPEINIIVSSNKDFYEMRLIREASQNIHYDVWINNGEGDNTSPNFIKNLTDSGVKIFTGGANNFLKIGQYRKDEEYSLALISQNNCWAWPDAATSGGGWTLAVFDVFTRCQHNPSNTVEIQKSILKTITSRNSKLVDDVFDKFPLFDNRNDYINYVALNLWDFIDNEINSRLEQSTNLTFEPKQIKNLANVLNWKMY